MLLVQFSFPKADRITCLLMFSFVEFFVCCYCRRWVSLWGSLSNIRCARSQRCRSAGSVVAVPAAAAVAPHTRQRTHTLGYLLDSFSQLSQFWFSDIRITNGGMCLMRKALLIKLAKNGLSPILTRSGFTDRC